MIGENSSMYLYEIVNDVLIKLDNEKYYKKVDFVGFPELDYTGKAPL